MRSRQRFRENVYKIIITRDEFDTQSAMKNTTPRVVIINLDVLGSRMKDWIRGQSNSRVVITPQNGNVRKKKA